MNDSLRMMNRSFQIWQPEDTIPSFQNPRTALAPAAAIRGCGVGGGVKSYKQPAAQDPQLQNRAKARRFFYPKKKKFARLFPPLAPRNTTSFIIRAKRAGGIASLVSPCPVTPTILPTPKFSPTRGESLVDTAKEEWGVDGYGSMKGIIRLRSTANEDNDDDDNGAKSGESELEEHLEVERRIDHGLSRFELVYPTGNVEDAAAYVLESRDHHQETQIAHLQEENSSLRDRVYLVEQEIGELRRRLQLLETDCYQERDARRSNYNEILSKTNSADTADLVDEGSEHNGGGDLCLDDTAGEDDHS